MQLRVAPIVEGHGEYVAIRSLLEKIWCELLGGNYIEVIRPIRHHQGTLRKEEGLKAAVELAKNKLAGEGLILVMIDSEGQAPCKVAPQLLSWAKEARSDADVACVLPHPMYETWFVASASSLRGYGGLPADLQTPQDPEEKQFGRAWIESRMTRKYSRTIDQPKLTARIDVNLCRANSPSFDKLCRELKQRRGND